MTVHITMKREKPAPIPTPQEPPSNIRRVRKWGDPVMTAQGLSTVIIMRDGLTSNFQAVGLCNKTTGFGAVTNWLSIPQADIIRLYDMQKYTLAEDKRIGFDYPIDKKMDWLFEEKGSIYFGLSDWRTQSAEWGTLALGGNLVNVEGYETMTWKFPDGKVTTAKFARLKGFRKSDWTRPFHDIQDEQGKVIEYGLLSLGLVHRCYCAYYSAQRKEHDVFGDSPKGVVYSPFWSPLDWKFNGQNNATHLYIPESWLET